MYLKIFEFWKTFKIFPSPIENFPISVIKQFLFIFFFKSSNKFLFKIIDKAK